MIGALGIFSTLIVAGPGVKAAGATSVLPFGGNWSTSSFEIEGYQVPPDQPGPWGDLRIVSPGFFEASFTPTDPLHIARNGYTLDTKRGLQGRTFTEVLDRAEANWRQNYPSS